MKTCVWSSQSKIVLVFVSLAQQVKWDYHEIKYPPVSIIMGLCAHELRQSIDDNIDAADVEGE